MKKALSLAIAIILAMSSVVYAASPVTKEYTVQYKSKDFSSVTVKDLERNELKDVRTEIRVEGKKYKAAKVEVHEISREKPIKRSRTYHSLSEKKVPEMITLKKGKDAGTKLLLADVSYTENRRNAATGMTTFTGTNHRPDAPATKEITATLPDGSTITVTGQLQKVEKTGSSYNKPFTVNAKFTGDPDVSYYKLGDIKIPNNPESPVFDGYQQILLQHLGYDSSKYRITSGKWTSDYKQENGQTVRYAQFSGLQSTADWTAYYTETITADSPQLATYDATAEYTNGVADTSYEVAVTVTYEKVGLTLLQKILIASAAVIVIAGLIAAILLIMRKKRAKNEETVTITE